jgi:hypothetical protein
VWHTEQVLRITRNNRRRQHRLDDAFQILSHAIEAPRRP